MRAFLGVDLPARLREEFAALGRSIPKLRAQQAGTIHLTMRFLGEIVRPEPVVEAVAPAVATHGPFELELRGIGGFPRSRNARVVWIGLGEGEMLAGALAMSVENALVEKAGFERESRPWRGHVTLGRFRSPHRLAPEHADHERVFGRFSVREVVLYRSTLTPQGAIHDPVSRMSLGLGM